jgi:putative transposase
MSDNVLPVRKRLRLENYDYTQGGAYYLTIDVLERRPLLGSVVDGKLSQSALGNQVAALWQSIAERYAGVIVDEWIVMPDHMHGILITTTLDPHQQLPSVIDIVRDFKSRTTREYWDYVNQHGFEDWLTKLWQRSYYERVIRSEEDLFQKRNYIRTNPQRYDLKRAGLL